MKLVSLMLTLVLLVIPCVHAAAESTLATASSELWEAIFLAVLDACEVAPDSAFTVTEFPERDPAFRFADSRNIGAIVACDLESTEEQGCELMKALCPMFDGVLSREERRNGAQVAELRGINYMMALNDEAKTVRFFTNVRTES